MESQESTLSRSFPILLLFALSRVETQFLDEEWGTKVIWVFRCVEQCVRCNDRLLQEDRWLL